MLSRITKHLDHQIRGSIHHQMLFPKIWRRCDMADESNRVLNDCVDEGLELN